MNTLYVVAGGQEQRSLRLPAAQLYYGRLFSASVTHARRFAREEGAVRILSPQFGLLSQGRLIEPYHLSWDELDAHARAELVGNIRSELPRREALPLRIVVLAPDDGVELFRNALTETRFESVPIRSPLSGLTFEQQMKWLQAATWSLECGVKLPANERLSGEENRRLRSAVSVAATWWSEQLMQNAPPPEPTLFANFLALELGKRWEEVASTTRGEWPEDIGFMVDCREATSPIASALRAVGLEPRGWWKREGRGRLSEMSMRFSMNKVTASTQGKQQIVLS